MTGIEAANAVRKKLNRLDTASNRTIRPEMCLFYLNEALTKIVKDRYEEKVKGDPKAFQRTQLVTDELNHFTKRADATPLYNMVSKSWEVGFPLDYYVGLYASAQTSQEGKVYQVTDINIVTLDVIGYALNDPFNEPIVTEPLAYYSEGKIIFPTKEQFNVDKVSIIYLHLPEEITTSTVIQYSLIEEAIDLAAVMILESWQSPRVQSKVTIDNMEV